MFIWSAVRFIWMVAVDLPTPQFSSLRIAQRFFVCGKSMEPYPSRANLQGSAHWLVQDARSSYAEEDDHQ
jgi:hypothetical protein